MIARAMVLLAIACRSQAPAPGTPDDLAAYLANVAGADEASRTREVASWILDERTWNRTIVDPWRTLYLDYTRAFDAARPALVARLAAGGHVAARRHYAGDPQLTRSEARLRWALPVQYPSVVADLAGAPIDAVFVYDGARWRALAGLDEVVLAHVRALDPACGDLLTRAGPRSRCTEVGWAVADAALRGDHTAFAHVCGLAGPLCGNEAP